MLFVTHDLGVIARICQRVAVMYAGRVVECASVKDIFEKPAHWYTKALLNSMPVMDRKVARLTSMDGTPPRTVDVQTGCRFAPRCHGKQARCEVEEPPVETVGPDHETRCWFPCTGVAR